MTFNAYDSEIFPELHNWRRELSEAATRDLQARISERKLVQGEALYHHGDEADCGYEVVSGIIEIKSYSSDGKEMLLASMQENECFGISGMINGGDRPNNAIAAADTIVSSLQKKDFEELCQAHPEISRRMNEVLARRFDYMFSLIHDANLLPLYERIGRTLIRLALSQNSGAIIGEVSIVDCSQEKLSRMVSAARPSVGREISKMKTAGLLRHEYGSIKIYDFNKMIEVFGRAVDDELLKRNLS